MSDEVGKLASAIDAAPDDPQGYAVYGDWLSQQGDPRGELIALQLLPSLDRKQRERVKALLYEPTIRCLPGPLAHWRWGFVHTATLLRPTTATDQVDLGALLRHPSMRFVRAFTLGQEPLSTALATLAANAPRVLSALTLYAPREFDLSLVPTTLPSLRRLGLSVPQMTGRLPLLPGLRAIELAYADFGQAHDELLFGANRLTLTEVKLVVSLEPERALLDAVFSLPNLSTFTLEAQRVGATLLEALEQSPAMERLTRLDLMRSGLSERAAKKMLALTRRMPRLTELVLGDPAWD
ncbi:MAG: TIGR02996 domain-containing protein [Myxococcaceae bacterium]|jgi:uncharacterized protein (TIGR02996 family)|nr:TIGR02996 domain-containing protein [Myxococcaceae bacterium]